MTDQSSISPEVAQPISTGWSADIRASLLLGWPLILTNLAQVGMNATNLGLMGHLGTRALAAGSLATSLYQMFMIFCMGLASASLPMIATTLGKRRHPVKEVRRTVRQGLWSVALVCLPIWAVMWYAEPLLITLGQKPDLAAEAAIVMRAMQWGLLPYLGYIVLRSFVAAMEKTFWTLAVAASAMVFNAIVAVMLILGVGDWPGLGLRGAGVAVSVSSLWMFVGMALVVVTQRDFRRYHLFGRFWRPDWPRFFELWRIGLPMAIIFAFETTIFYAAVIMMGIIGRASLAAHAVAIQIVSIGFMVPLGFGQVATIRVGRANGAGDAGAVARAGWSAYGLGVGFMACMAVVLLMMPLPLIGLFLNIHDPENREVVALCVRFLGLAGLFQVADGAQAIAAGMLRGLHDTRVPMAFAAVGYWVIGVPTGAFFAFWLGWEGVGLWSGLLVGLTIVAALLTWRWVRRDGLALLSRN